MILDHFCYLWFVFDRCTFWSVPCSLVVCWERPDLFALLYAMFYCAYVTFTYGVLGQIWYFIPDLCPFSCFVSIYTIILIGKQRADCFALTVYLMSYDSRCSVALPLSTLGWSAIFHCGISLSYPFAFLLFTHMKMVSCTYPVPTVGQMIKLTAACW